MATTNGLEVVNEGSFEDDPSSDGVDVFAHKMNMNTAVLDVTVGLARTTATKMNIVESTGLLELRLWGGLY